MIDREQFARALEEIRDLRALLAFERFSYDQLAAKIERDEADLEASRKIPWRKSA